MTESPDRRRGWCPGALRPMRSGDGLLVRIKPSCGVVSLDQAEAIATLARDHGNGLIELTSRGNLQLRGVRPESLDSLTSALDALGLLDATPEAEAVRNVITSPLAGIDATAFDTHSIVEALEQRLMAETSLSALSDKFGFVVDGGGTLPLDDVEADIRFVWTGEEFAVALAREPRCDCVGVCSPSDVPDVAIALARGFLAHAGTARRLRHLSDGQRDQISKSAGVQFGNAAVNHDTDTANKSTIEPVPPTPSSRRRPGPTQVSAVSTSQDLVSHTRSRGVEQTDVGVDPGLRRDDVAIGGSVGEEARRVATSSIWLLQGAVGAIEVSGGRGVAGIGLPYGGTTSTDLLSLVALAREAGAAELRLTPWRVILIPGVGQSAVQSLLAGAVGLGFITDPADVRRAIAACPGAPACGSGTTPVRADADLFAEAAAGLLDDGASLHVSGCAKGCAHRRPAALTVVASGGRYGLVVNGAASNPAFGRFTAPEIAETLARVASAVTKAGNASHTSRSAAIAAALKEILAA